MADERSRSPRPSWKRAVEEPAGGEDSAYEWNKRRTKPVREGKTSPPRGLKVAGVLAAVLGCIALMVILIIMFQPPKPAAVVLVGADYSSNLAIPHNVLGWRGLQGIAALSRTERPWAIFNPASLVLLQGGPVELKLPETWDEIVNNLARTTRSQKTLLFVLALHGMTTADSAYLVPNQAANPTSEALDLKRVIESMAQLPPEQNKILVLEGSLIPAEWHQGMLYNDFARRLQDLEPEIAKIPNLWVLSGCDVDQLCWTSEGLGRSAFLHFIIEALRGRAAGDDRRLSLEELHGYVRDNVRNWAWNARRAIQEPVLLPRAENGGRGKSAAPANRRGASQVYLASVDNAASPEVSSSWDRAAAEEPWKRCQAMDALVPHPSVYSPRRWREFRARAIRAGDLIRAGATAAQLQPVMDRLGTLEIALRGERQFLRLAESSQNNLVMNVVQGGILDSQTNEQAFHKLWNPQGGVNPTKAWEELQEANRTSGSGPTRPLRSRVDEFLIEQAAADPFHNLATAASRLAQTRGNDYPQPAEAHYVVMLNKYLGPVVNQRLPSFWPTVSRAIRVRRLAERTALGLRDPDTDYALSERVFPWIKALVAEADQKRRLGEDRILSAEESDWTQADRLLKDAERIYDTAIRRAGIVRSALHTRDFLLAALPDYSRWIAHRHPDDIAKDDLTEPLGEAWSNLHRLTALLETPKSDVESGTIESLDRAIRDRLQTINQRFVEQSHRFNAERRIEDHETVVAALSVPSLDPHAPPPQSDLWERLESIGKHDLEVASKGESTEPTPDDRENAVMLLRRRAKIQGGMAIASLGQYWFENENAAGTGEFDRTRRQILSPFDEKAADPGREPWWKLIAVAGEAVGRRWREIGPEIDRFISQEGRDLFSARNLSGLARADRLGRFIDQESAPVPEARVEATSADRQARVHGLLLWLAERARLDHWFDEDPKAIKPYYRAVGQRFANDAGRLIPKSDELTRVQNELAIDDKLQLEGPNRILLTTEQAMPLTYRVTTTGNPEQIPPGLPVIKPALDSELTLVEGAAGFRTAPWRTGGDTVPLVIASPKILGAERDKSLTRPKMTPTRLSLDGVFRGQHFTSRTEVEIHPVPDQVAIGLEPPPPGTRVAVRASKEVISRFGEGQGAIAIVLDCSGSMNHLTSEGEKKYSHAKKALAQVLKQIPNGTTVSLWTFSQLTKGQQPPLTTDPIAREPERTITCLYKPTPWAREQTDGVIKLLDDLTPYLDTPLVQAMAVAAGQDLQDPKKGFRTLLVLTDGDDTRFMKSDSINPRKIDIPTYLKSYFGTLGVRVNLVYYSAASTSPDEEAKIRANFEKPLQSLEPPGSFITADNLDQLVASLKRGIRQQLTWQILKANGEPIANVNPSDVTAPGEQDDWSRVLLEPGFYKLRVTADRSFDQEISLKPGDRLLVKLVEEGNGIGFERGLHSDDFPTRVESESQGWRLAGLESYTQKTDGKDTLQLLASLEEKPTRGESRGVIDQVFPRHAWFRLEAQAIANLESLYTVRWYSRSLYPSPVWEINVPEWPRDPGGLGLAKPVLKAWWSNDGGSPKFDLIRKLTAGEPGQGLPATLSIDESSAVVNESVDVEDHRVEVRRSVFEQKPCLVVRLAYPRGNPFFIDPRGVTGLEDQILGHEHRFFLAADKYTGIFWPITRSQLDRLTSVGLNSLPAVLKRAEARKSAATIAIPDPETGHLKEPASAILNVGPESR